MLWELKEPAFEYPKQMFKSDWLENIDTFNNDNSFIFWI